MRKERKIKPLFEASENKVENEVENKSKQYLDYEDYEVENKSKQLFQYEDYERNVITQKKQDFIPMTFQLDFNLAKELNELSKDFKQGFKKRFINNAIAKEIEWVKSKRN